VQLRRSFVRRYLEWCGVLLVLSIPCRGSPLCVNPLVVLMPRADHAGVTNLWGLLDVGCRLYNNHHTNYS
jgi:hypothetical protein